jgi:hypothetical protein
VLPEQINALVLLHILKVRGAVNATQNRARYDLGAAELIVPVRGLAAGVMHQALVRIDGRVRYLTLDRHHAPVFEPRHHVSPGAGQPSLAAEVTGRRRGGEDGDFLRLDFLHAEAGKQVLDRLLLRLLRGTAAPGPYVARRCEGGRRDHGALPFIVGRLATFRYPREAVRVYDRQHRVANTLGAACIGAEPRGRERGVGDGFEIVLRDRWRCQVTERLLRVAAINQVGDELGIDRVGGDVR